MPWFGHDAMLGSSEKAEIPQRDIPRNVLIRRWPISIGIPDPQCAFLIGGRVNCASVPATREPVL